MGWATLWAIFSQTHPVALATNDNKGACFLWPVVEKKNSACNQK
jgi:hypothetical protein